MGEKMMMMRRTGQWVLAMVCAAGLAACGGSTDDKDKGHESDATEITRGVQHEADGMRMSIATLLDRRVERIILPADAPEHERVLVEFIDFMREADIETAMLLVDPSSPGYEDMELALAAIAMGQARYDGETGIPVDSFLRMMFTVAYDSCEYERLNEDADEEHSVRYRLTFHDSEPVLFETEDGRIIRFNPDRPAAAEIIVTVHSVDGEWFLYPEKDPQGLIRPAGLRRERPSED